VIGVVICGVAKIVLVIVFIILPFGGGLRFIKVFPVERSDPVGPDFRVVHLINGVRGERAESHREAAGIKARRSQSGVDVFFGRYIHRISMFSRRLRVLQCGGRWRDLESLAIVLLLYKRLRGHLHCIHRLFMSRPRVGWQPNRGRFAPRNRSHFSFHSLISSSVQVLFIDERAKIVVVVSDIGVVAGSVGVAFVKVVMRLLGKALCWERGRW
jgi:hypothetical protein